MIRDESAEHTVTENKHGVLTTRYLLSIFNKFNALSQSRFQNATKKEKGEGKEKEEEGWYYENCYFLEFCGHKLAGQTELFG